MRAILQRVQEASVSIEGKMVSNINHGLLVLLGIETEDTNEDIEWLTNKIVQMRIFSDKDGKMNHSLLDLSGEVLLVSQFTLFASSKKGNRPSFIKSARPEIAIPLYEKTIKRFQTLIGVEQLKTGEFGADMKVQLINDGPVTLFIDSKNKE
ncbi:MAG: D-tyrosyl-tRNA(Tyr) deacylase [Bacteroidetes bacterium]|nr:D-tyrosyl-tRNA(Tyr) deacylase [Bacteroidota bacterium]